MSPNIVVFAETTPLICFFRVHLRGDGYTKAGAPAVPPIASAVQTPTLSPQTIGAMADAIASQADSIVEAYEKGKQDRLEVNNAIVDAQRTIQASTNRVSDEVVNKLVEKASERLSIQ